ncbi:hypothetical protein FKG96_08610 [Olivibacter sp. LS-1]|uniref:hypothetical protein n=1 Tax=Olivibacter sp. LS-1 TaxID=2592345 RepID=UPI0011EACD18|nr:hypothetical protein [Olivibacter sp. LS-1]QEL00867.1 hypothetical protein FKG96_08610 [Olivibacter sp. LS-1]
MKKVTKDSSLGTLLQWWCINLQTANFLGDILVERRVLQTGKWRRGVGSMALEDTEASSSKAYVPSFMLQYPSGLRK